MILRSCGVLTCFFYLQHADETESTNLYLQSALKFLQSAALMESVQAESRSTDLYKDTAGLCEYASQPRAVFP